MQATIRLAPKVGVQAACSALGLPRATYYRHRHPRRRSVLERPRPPLALTPDERQAVVDVLHAPRFVDLAPRQIWATLLDDEQQHLRRESAKLAKRLIAELLDKQSLDRDQVTPGL